jgi:hypothetical protein
LDLEIHLKFNSGTVDAHFTSLDLKALMESGLMNKFQQVFKDMIASMTVRTGAAQTSEPTSEQAESTPTV